MQILIKIQRKLNYIVSKQNRTAEIESSLLKIGPLKVFFSLGYYWWVSIVTLTLR